MSLLTVGRIVVCVTGRNHAEHAKETLDSIRALRAPLLDIPWSVRWIDDASDEGAPGASPAVEIADRLLPVGDKVIENVYAVGGLANFHKCIDVASPRDVLVFVGGDGDTLTPSALAQISQKYEDPECWLTYGTLRNSDGSPAPYSRRMPDNVDPRSCVFGWAPLTVRAWLAKKILREDLMLTDTLYMPAGGDVALTLPLVEMAGPSRCRFIEEPWYVRKIHARNDHVVNRRLQNFCAWDACTRPRYSRLASPEDTPTRTPHVLDWSIAFYPELGEATTLPGGIMENSGGVHGESGAEAMSYCDRCGNSGKIVCYGGSIAKCECPWAREHARLDADMPGPVVLEFLRWLRATYPLVADVIDEDDAAIAAEFFYESGETMSENNRGIAPQSTAAGGTIHASLIVHLRAPVFESGEQSSRYETIEIHKAPPIGRNTTVVLDIENGPDTTDEQIGRAVRLMLALRHE